MPVKMRRRRVKKRRRPGDISRMKFVWIIAIMILAVFLGYLTAKFVIGPLLGYNADESPMIKIKVIRKIKITKKIKLCQMTNQRLKRDMRFNLAYFQAKRLPMRCLRVFLKRV